MFNRISISTKLYSVLIFLMLAISGLGLVSWVMLDRVAFISDQAKESLEQVSDLHQL